MTHSKYQAIGRRVFASNGNQACKDRAALWERCEWARVLLKDIMTAKGVKLSPHQICEARDFLKESGDDQ